MGLKPKVITIYDGKKAGFDYKNNHEHYKLAIFWIDVICKVNFRLLVMMSYILLGLGSKNVSLI